MKFLPLGIFALLILYFFHPIPLQGTNVDLGHHLLLGKITVESRHIPQTNLISYIYPTYRFVNNQWLSDVVFYYVHSIFGFNGLTGLSVLLVCGCALALYYSIRSKDKLIPLAIVSLFYLQIITDRTEIKPELFSYLFLSVFLAILYRYREKYTSLIFLLLPLEAVWINFHIFFFLGIAVSILFTLDALIIKHEKISSKKLQILVAATIGTFFATLFNPNFINGSLYPLVVLRNYGYNVIENMDFFHASFSYADVTFVYFGISVIALFVGIFVFFNKLRKIDIALTALFTFLAFFAVRNFPLFVIGTFIPFVSVISLFLKPQTNKHRIIFLLAILVLILPAIVRNFSLHGIGFGVIDNADQAITFFKENNLNGPIYNNYNIGNYLEYRLYPSEHVFVDGNPEQYPKEFFTNIYYPSESSFKTFEKLSNMFQFNVIIYEHKNQTKNTNPLLFGLVNSPDWRMVYLNNSLVIFLKNDFQNRNIISKYTITEKNVAVSRSDLADKSKVGDLSNFFRVIGWYGVMEKMDMRYLDFDPNNCTALRHVAAVLRAQNSISANQYLFRYQTSCGSQ